MIRIAVLAGLVSAVWTIGPARAQTPPPRPTMWYWHNWTDHAGISHMTKCPVRDFDLKTMSKPAGPQWQDRMQNDHGQVIFTVQPAHWNGTWHPDPKVQWIIPLRGAWYVTAMDGHKVVMGPGDVSLGEDQLSRKDRQGRVGHDAGNVGDGPVELMVVQTDETPTADRPCRFK
ncbi:cupin domain-containing protein [Gluconacetobacter johannae]|uniref:cupin domain-containing protein n=1 Tax=Gluconacetobacter johannae TaxID=112140 RepID=UPI003570AAE3